MATRARTRTRLTCSFSPASYPSLISSASPLVGRVLHPETPRPPTPRPFLDTARDTGPPPLEERPHSTLVTLVLACVFLTHWLPWDTPFVSLYLLSAYGTGCPQRRLGAFGSRLYPSYEAARAATRRPGEHRPPPGGPRAPQHRPPPGASRGPPPRHAAPGSASGQWSRSLRSPRACQPALSTSAAGRRLGAPPTAGPQAPELPVQRIGGEGGDPSFAASAGRRHTTRLTLGPATPPAAAAPESQA